MSYTISTGQHGFITSLVKERLATLGFASVEDALVAMALGKRTDTGAFVNDTSRITKHDASKLIDKLMAIPTDPDPSMPEIVLNSNRRGVNSYDGKCHTCGWDVEMGKGYYFSHPTGYGWAMHHKVGECPAGTPPVEQELETGRIYTIEDENGNTAFARVKESKAGNQYVMVNRGHGWKYEKETIRTVRKSGNLLTSEQAAAFGHMTGTCIVCEKELSTNESLSVGYGPVCAKNNGWPWGKEAA